MEVNCEGLAVIGATLANGGVCPTSLERVIKPEAVRDVLSLLHSCGFYEYSGQFAFKVINKTYFEPILFRSLALIRIKEYYYQM